MSFEAKPILKTTHADDRTVIYAFAVAHEMGWDGPAQTLIDHASISSLPMAVRIVAVGSRRSIRTERA